MWIEEMLQKAKKITRDNYIDADSPVRKGEELLGLADKGELELYSLLRQKGMERKELLKAPKGSDAAKRESDLRVQMETIAMVMRSCMQGRFQRWGRDLQLRRGFKVVDATDAKGFNPGDYPNTHNIKI